MTAFGKVISSLSHKKVITRCHRKYKLMLNRKKDTILDINILPLLMFQTLVLGQTL